jgi:hypothetical protein
MTASKVSLLPWRASDEGVSRRLIRQQSIVLDSGLSSKPPGNNVDAVFPA